MGGVGVPERIGIDVLADPGARLGAHEDPVDTAGGEGTAPGPAGKQDGVRPDRLRVRLQDGVQVRRERDVAVLAPFALLEPSTAVRAAAPSSPMPWHSCWRSTSRPNDRPGPMWMWRQTREASRALRCGSIARILEEKRTWRRRRPRSGCISAGRPSISAFILAMPGHSFSPCGFGGGSSCRATSLGSS